jgi:hypothetical protein
LREAQCFGIRAQPHPKTMSRSACCRKIGSFRKYTAYRYKNKPDLPVCDRFVGNSVAAAALSAHSTCTGSPHSRGLSRLASRNRTPTPPPFSSMNPTPAAQMPVRAQRSPKATREAGILSFFPGRIGSLAADCFRSNRRFGRRCGFCGFRGSGPSKADARLIAIGELDTGGQCNDLSADKAVSQAAPRLHYRTAARSAA